MLKDFNELSSAYGEVEIKSNYHTHNYLCGHAGGTVSDYCKEAVAHGLDTLGVSDHCAPPVGTCMPYMTPETMPRDYLPQFDEARARFGKSLRILSAVEIEYFDGHDGYYKDLLRQVDYLVMGQHEYILDGRRKNSFADGVDERNVVAYFRNVIRGLKTDMFAVLAHPDLIFYRNPEITPAVLDAFEETVATAVEHGVALELNANGIRNHAFRYPTDLLIELCEKHGASVVVSSDCHDPKVLCDEYMLRLYAYAKKKKLDIVTLSL